jgi:hypothetical protein
MRNAREAKALAASSCASACESGFEPQKGVRMPIQLSGSWNVTVTSSIPPQAEYGSQKRFVVTGATRGSGSYLVEPGATGNTVAVSGGTWLLTPQNRNRLHGDLWLDCATLVAVQPGLVIIGANEDEASGPHEDLVLTCTALPHSQPLPQRYPGTWVSWGAMVDGGGQTANGPASPWDGSIKEFAAGLALGEAARLVHPDLRAGVLDLAGKQVVQAATAIVQAMSRGFRD